MKNDITAATIARALVAHDELYARLKKILADEVVEIVQRKNSSETPLYGTLSWIRVTYKDATEVDITFKPVNNTSKYDRETLRYFVEVKGCGSYLSQTPRCFESKGQLDLVEVQKKIEAEVDRVREHKKYRANQDARAEKAGKVIKSLESETKELSKFSVYVRESQYGTDTTPQFTLDISHLSAAQAAKALKALKEALL